MDTSILRQISALQRKSVAELQGEWLRMYGEAARSRNKQFLFRRLAWRIQELQHGGLSDAARDRIDKLAPDGFTRVRTPARAARAADSVMEPQPYRRRDSRLPLPGTVLTRKYRDHEIRVVTLDDSFEWEGRRYGSLSAVARAVTGQKWNGWLFFGLTKRRRASSRGGAPKVTTVSKSRHS